jgi:Uma2 family endonuclease
VTDVLITPIEHLVLPQVSWDTFERLIDEKGKARLRVSYLDGQVEFMRTELGHHNLVQGIERLAFVAALERRVPIRSGGSATLKQPACRLCIEPDACFWIKTEATMRSSKQWIARTDPPPDLAIEVDVPYACLDRMRIFAALRVTEVWRFDGDRLEVHLLNASGRYRKQTRSTAFPWLPMNVLDRFVKKLGSADEVALIQEFIEWLRSNVVGKYSSEQKNGRR